MTGRCRSRPRIPPARSSRLSSARRLLASPTAPRLARAAGWPASGRPCGTARTWRRRLSAPASPTTRRLARPRQACYRGCSPGSPTSAGAARPPLTWRRSPAGGPTPSTRTTWPPGTGRPGPCLPPRPALSSRNCREPAHGAGCWPPRRPSPGRWPWWSAGSVGYAGTSRTTSVAFLSSRRPRKRGWRSSPSCVHSVNPTWATSSGRTQCTPWRGSLPRLKAE